MHVSQQQVGMQRIEIERRERVDWCNLAGDAWNYDNGCLVDRFLKILNLFLTFEEFFF